MKRGVCKSELMSYEMHTARKFLECQPQGSLPWHVDCRKHAKDADKQFGTGHREVGQYLSTAFAGFCGSCPPLKMSLGEATSSRVQQGVGERRPGCPWQEVGHALLSSPSPYASSFGLQ